MMDRDLQKRLDAVCRRLRLLSLLQAAVSGMVAASAVCALLLVASLVLPLPAYALWWLSGLAGLIILFVRWDRAQSRLDAAFLIDSQLGLQERVTAATEFSSLDRAQPVLIRRLQADAARLASDIDPRRIVPYRMPRKSLLLPPLFLLVFVLHTALPEELAYRGSATDPLTTEAVQEQIEELQLLSDLFMEQAAAEDRPDLARFSEILRELAERLARGELTLDELRAELSRLEEQLGASLDPFSPADLHRGDDGTRTEPARSAPPEPPAPGQRGEQPHSPSEPGPPDAAVPPQDAPEHDIGEGHEGPDGGYEEGRDGSDREQGGQGLPEDDVIWDETEVQPVPGPLEAPDSGDEGEQGDRAGTGEGSSGDDDTAPSDRLETDGTRERLSGQLDPSQATVERLDRLTTPLEDAAPHISAPAGDAAIIPGYEATVLHEEVPPHLRALVRRYFEQLAGSD